MMPQDSNPLPKELSIGVIRDFKTVSGHSGQEDKGYRWLWFVDGCERKGKGKKEKAGAAEGSERGGGCHLLYSL